MICEKCWGDAYARSLGSGKPQVDCYREILEERKDRPCEPWEQWGMSAEDWAGSQTEDTPSHQQGTDEGTQLRALEVDE